MPALARGQSSDCGNPVLDIYTTVQGVKTDVAALEFQVWEKVSDPEVPVQVYPPSGRAVVDLVSCPAGHKLSTGHYVAEYTPGLTELIGTHELRWFFRLTLGSPEQTLREEFEVLAEVTGATSDGYTTIAAMREQGITLTMASDERLRAVIAMSSQRIERWTGRWFEPRSCIFTLDGNGGPSLLLNDPIIRLDSVRYTYANFDEDPFIDVSAFKVYNRHITQKLFSPDDRENPRIEWLYEYGYDNVRRGIGRGQVWPKGSQNIEIGGIFGYTEPDGSALGRTPIEIERATQLLAIRDIYPLADRRREEWLRRSRVASMSTEGQSISWTAGAGGVSNAPLSGDPEVDRIIAAFIRPPIMAAV